MINRVRLIKDLLWFLSLAALVAAVFRLWFGLGATTNLTDAVPWGLWKILNMVAGVALSTGGFTIGLLVYVLKIDRFKPLLKPAILIAFLGYGCSLFALLFDIGLPHRFWHPFLMWNENSFLFEVFWCVAVYFTVTFIEFSPTILERLKAHRLVGWIHGLAFGTVVFGISLSSLHHSSLGSLFLVTPQRLHPLWYSSMLPVFFILSAMGGGMMCLLLIRILYARWHNPEPVFGPEFGKGAVITCLIDGKVPNGRPRAPQGKDLPMLGNLATIAASILGVYFVLKIVDLVRTGAWQALTAGTWESFLYSAELLISVIIPLVLIAVSRTRRSPLGLGLAAFSASVGLALNRLDVGIFGYFRDVQVVYFPSLIEWVLGLGVVAAAGLVFLFIVENFAIFEERLPGRRLTKGFFRASSDTLARVWSTVLNSNVHRVTLIGVFTIAFAWIVLYPPYSGARSEADMVQPSIGLDASRGVLRIDGNRTGVYTDFPHAAHQQRLGGDSSCMTCHHLSMPKDRNTPCSRCHRNMVYAMDIFDHPYHLQAVAHKENLSQWHPSNHTCVICHGAGRPKTTGNVKTCLECHREDMFLAGGSAIHSNISSANSFREAMHGVCIPCHQQEQEKVDRSGLSDCFTCHQSLKARPVALRETADCNNGFEPLITSKSTR